MSAALMRVELLLAGATPAPAAVIKTTYGDLRALVALAKRADELKRRLRLARNNLLASPAHRHGFDNVLDDVGRLLDMRRPLPKGRKKR